MLPIFIPFTFNDLPTEMRAGRVIDPNEAIKEADRRQELLRKLQADLEKLQIQTGAVSDNRIINDDEEEIITTTTKGKTEEPEGMYL